MKWDRFGLMLTAYGHKLARIVVDAKHESRAADRSRAAFYERAWREAASELGGSIEPLGEGVFDIRKGSGRVRVCANESPLDNGVTLRVAGDKPLVHRILTQAGIPVPRHVTCTAATLGQAFRFAEEIGWPVVVKPASGTGGGVGVSANIRNKRALFRALAWARSFGAQMLVEEQLNGEIYRLLYFDGELLDCVVRRAPTLTGDGRSSIADLIEAENRRRAECGTEVAQGLLWADQDLRRELGQQGLTMRSVLAAGQRVRVKRVINDNRGEDNETAALSPEIVQAGRRAVEAVGARLAGVDIMTADPNRALEQSGGAVIEINTTPGYYYHYHKKDGRVPVARFVLERALKETERHDGRH